MALSLPQRLYNAALRCCESEDGEEAEETLREFLETLETPMHNGELKVSGEGNQLALCEEMLTQAMELLEPTTTPGKVLCEKVGLELPLVVVKFVGLSQTCQDRCHYIIEALAQTCSPREMFVAFMEALNIYTTLETLLYCIPLLQGLSLVFPRLQRQQAGFFKEASPGLLALARLAMQEEENLEIVEVGEGVPYSGAVNTTVPVEDLRAAILDDLLLVAQAVRETCSFVEVEQQREVLQQSLGKFILQLLGITGGRVAYPDREVPAIVVELVGLLPSCGLSLSLLLTGDQIEALTKSTGDNSVEPEAASKLEVMNGAAFAVYWALSNTQVAAAAEDSTNSLKENLQSSGSKGVIAALCVATSLLSKRSSIPSPSLPEIGLALIFLILEIVCPIEVSDDNLEEDDWPTLTLRVVPVLQALEDLIIYTPNIEMKRRVYTALRKVIQEVLPDFTRFHSLQALINSCPYASLISLSLNCVKDEVARAWPASMQQGEIKGGRILEGEALEGEHPVSPFVSREVLQVVANVLRLPDGGPPNLPYHIDPVQSALNLYRFILIRESSGKTNYTGVLSKPSLTKARTQWLLPLCEHVGGVRLGLVVEDDEESAIMSLAIDNLQSVLHRCLELTEEALTNS